MSLKFPVSLVGKRVSPESFTYRGEGIPPDATVRVSYTFVDFDIGPAHPDRTIIVGYAARAGSQGWGAAKIQLDGVNATLITRSPNFSASNGSAIYSMPFPTGDTADITIFPPVATNIYAINVYSVIKPNLTIHAFGSIQNAALNVNTADGGYAIAVCTDRGAGSISWPNTLIEDGNIFVGNSVNLGAASNTTDGSVLNIPQPVAPECYVSAVSFEA